MTLVTGDEGSMVDPRASEELDQLLAQARGGSVSTESTPATCPTPQVSEGREPAADPDAVRSARRVWELGEHLADLQLELGRRAEREAITELEILALRKDLELASAYSAMQESAEQERRQAVHWLQEQLDRRSAELHETVTRLDDLQRRLDRALGEAAAADRRTDECARRCAAVTAELAAERARASFRLVAPVADRLGQNRLIRAAARRAVARADHKRSRG